VVGLHAADRHQRVGVGRKRVRNDVFELAQLVAAKGQPRIAVLALGMDLDLAAEMAGEPRQLLDMGGPESERIALEFLQHDLILQIGPVARTSSIFAAKGAF
jgi:hypothetical protein